MQIEIYKVNDLKDKLRTRKLYEETFDAGKDDFIDYYYDVIIRRNEVVVLVDESGEIISMVHLNPYLYSVEGNETKVHYLVAVATDTRYRGKGYMRMVLNEALRYLKDLGEAFCITVPDNESLMRTYSKFGFETVGEFNIDKFSNEKYDIFPVRNDEFNKLMEKEKSFLNLETKEYIEELKTKKVMLNVLDVKKLLYKSIEELKSKSIYVCQEV